MLWLDYQKWRSLLSAAKKAEKLFLVENSSTKKVICLAQAIAQPFATKLAVTIHQCYGLVVIWEYSYRSDNRVDGSNAFNSLTVVMRICSYIHHLKITLILQNAQHQ